MGAVDCTPPLRLPCWPYLSRRELIRRDLRLVRPLPFWEIYMSVAACLRSYIRCYLDHTLLSWILVPLRSLHTYCYLRRFSCLYCKAFLARANVYWIGSDDWQFGVSSRFITTWCFPRRTSKNPLGLPRKLFKTLKSIKGNEISILVSHPLGCLPEKWLREGLEWQNMSNHLKTILPVWINGLDLPI